MSGKSYMKFTIEHNPTKYKGVEWIVYGTTETGEGFCRPATNVEIALWQQYLHLKRERDEAVQQIEYMRRLRA